MRCIWSDLCYNFSQSVSYFHGQTHTYQSGIPDSVIERKKNETLQACNNLHNKQSVNIIHAIVKKDKVLSVKIYYMYMYILKVLQIIINKASMN